MYGYSMKATFCGTDSLSDKKEKQWFFFVCLFY